jgi:hypothetical protein
MKAESFAQKAQESNAFIATKANFARLSELGIYRLNFL